MRKNTPLLGKGSFVVLGENPIRTLNTFLEGSDAGRVNDIVGFLRRNGLGKNYLTSFDVDQEYRGQAKVSRAVGVVSVSPEEEEEETRRGVYTTIVSSSGLGLFTINGTRYRVKSATQFFDPDEDARLLLIPQRKGFYAPAPIGLTLMPRSSFEAEINPYA